MRKTPKFFSSLREMVTMNVNADPGHIAYMYKVNGEVVSVTNQQFYDCVENLGAALVEAGFGRSHIACLSENRYNWIEVYFTSLLTAGVFVPIDKELPADNVVYLLNDSASEIIFCSEKYEALLRAHESELPGLKYVICFDRDEDDGKYLSYKKFMASGEKLDKIEYDSLKSDDNELKYLVYTSGTTGVAKGVMLTEHNICCGIYYGMRVSSVFDKGLSVLPYNHTYEAVCEILVAFHSHTTLCINDSLRKVQENMKFYQPDYIFLVPAFSDHFYAAIWKGIEKKGMTKTFKRMIKLSNGMRKIGIDLRRKLFKSVLEQFGGKLEKIVCGGAPIRPEVGKFFDDIGISMTGGYGITECSPLVSVNDESDNNFNSAGHKLECLEWRIDEPDSDGIGEICVKGDVVMLGYYKRPDLTAEVLKDGWFYTGDYGYINEKDEIVITGRKKNIIIMSNGKNIYPEELEARIANIPYVTEVVVSGITNEHGQDVSLQAEIYIEDENADRSNLSADVKKACAELPPYKHITKIITRDEPFAKTTTNKIKRG